MTPVPASRHVSAPESLLPATALRVVWEPAAPPAATPVVGAVRVLARSAASQERVSSALRAAGVAVAADGTGGFVAVPDLDRPHDAGPSLEEFWTRLRDLASTLPAGAAVVWAEHRSVAVDDTERTVLDPSAAARTAAVRAAGAEGKLRVSTLDLDPTDAADVRAHQLVAELRAPDGATAYRRGQRLRSRTVPLPAAIAPTLDGDGFHLVTGGLGAVGRELVAQLAASGARAIGIVGRSPAGDLPTGLAAELAYLPADVTDPAALAAAVGEFGRRWGRLRGIVHCSGGVNPFGAVRRRSVDDARRVLDPKVAGSENVVRLAQAHGAQSVVLVSSIAGALTEAGPGVVDYAMANAHQLALAQREHGPVTAVTAHAWPNWSGTGMAADAGFAAAHSLTPAAARTAFAAHLVTGGAVILPGGATPAAAVAAPAVPATAQPAAAAPAPAVPAPGVPTSALASAAAAPAAAVPGPPVPLATVPAGTVLPPATPAAADPATAGPAGTRPDLDTVTRGVRHAFLDVLGEDPGDAEMARLGLDSVTIAELTAAVERRVGRSTDPSVLMRARTVGDIATALAGIPAPRAAEPVPAPASSLSSLLMTLIDPTTDGSH
ncbi:SDR family NAD(P)-dependent oxidoreductase [Pseudonocardia sp. KRD-169]|nr:SDR family NAD(P)-dependent oxidoreductase [Pseudonocardia abyssalis]